MGYIIRLSLTNLKMRRLRTWLTIIGIMIGTMSMVIMVTAAIGAKKAVENQIEMMGSTREIHVFTGSESRKDRLLTDELVEEFAKIKGVKKVYAVLEFAGWENIGGYSAYFPITGVSSDYLKTLDLESGALAESGGIRPQLIMGGGTKEIFYNSSAGLKYSDTSEGKKGLTGKRMDFIFTAGADSTSDSDGTAGGDSVVGSDGVSDSDRVKLNIIGETANPYDYRIYTDMDTLKRFLKRSAVNGRIPGQPVDKNGNPYKVWAYTEIIVEAEDTDSVEGISEIISNRGFQAENSIETLNNVNKMTGIIGIVLGIMGAVAAVVAVIGIINTMSTAVYDRMSDIGLLKMIGSDSYDIMMMFLFESGLLGFVGGVLGVAASYLIGLILNRKISDFLGFIEGTKIFSIEPHTAVLAIVAAVAVALMAGAFPAGRAAKVPPLNTFYGILNKT